MNLIDVLYLNAIYKKKSSTFQVDYIVTECVDSEQKNLNERKVMLTQKKSSHFVNTLNYILLKVTAFI